ncbi:trypsin-3-like [Rhineura floridana]|uniref:trypsin-3-like n=1 Tax=Rhineura floridana TaxID=261503 RepID=UPI002AC7FD13|nr:trypsin-3-like [Rhineura floridana]
MRPCDPWLLLFFFPLIGTAPRLSSKAGDPEHVSRSEEDNGFYFTHDENVQVWSDGERDSQRIIGGYIVAPHSSKYLVSLKRNTGYHFCGGALVSRSWVLTAAHCKTGIHQMLIVAGEYSLSAFEGTEQIFRPARMVVHPDYSAASKNADIMLIKLNRPVAYSPFVSIVPLPQQGAIIRDGRFCKVSGWGYTTPIGGRASDTLRSVHLPIISTWKCNSSSSYAGYITKNMICAGFNSGGKDACQGDSGGPLVCEGRVFGIVSWGHSCASPRYPGVYTAVANFQKWIYKTVFKK